MSAYPAWIYQCKDEMVTAINKLIQNITQRQQMPPPGTLSTFLMDTILKHSSGVQGPAPSKAPKLENLTPENIYEKPVVVEVKKEPAKEPVKVETKSEAPDYIEERAIAYIKANKPIRIADLADKINVPLEQLAACVAKSTKLTKKKAGWTRLAE